MIIMAKARDAYYGVSERTGLLPLESWDGRNVSALKLTQA